MHRLNADNVVNSMVMDKSMDDCKSDSKALHSEEHSFDGLQQQVQSKSKITAELLNTESFSNKQDIDCGAEVNPIEKYHEQHIHTIYSSDEENLFIEQNTIAENMGDLSSDQTSDFEGFDDYTAPSSSDLINDASQEGFDQSSFLQTHMQTHINENASNSDDVKRTAEVERDSEEIVINKDGKVVYRTVRKITPKKSSANDYEPCTPNKRKRSGTDDCDNAFSSAQLKTPPDQIVEVNSDSTTNSLKQKRQQINSKFQLSLCQQQNFKTNNNPNKCSTESTSEFPVSSPSNPQQPRCGKYPARPPLLKNTLPADSFERQLAMITACNPQMTLAEKIQSWDCEEEMSDLEDVRKFDEDFKRTERQKKLEMKQKNCGRVKNSELKICDFITFRQMIIDNIKEQKTQKYNIGGQSGGGCSGLTGAKCAESSESESSNSVIHVDDRPSTSAVAQQQLQQRRCKPQLYFEAGESKKRIIKNIPKRNQNSTTPPQTSSSDNERDCLQKSSSTGQHQTQIHDKLTCRSSSDGAISQDMPNESQLKLNHKNSQKGPANVGTKSLGQRINAQKKSNEKKKSPTSSRVITNEEVEAFFRPHRLSRERDKIRGLIVNKPKNQNTSIIQMRLDCSNERNTEVMKEKSHELFKTPIIPQKYLASPILSTEYQKKDSFILSKTQKNEDTKKEDNECTGEDSEEKAEVKSPFNDFDGVYHEQHEFCNYLGLTGMSTATAMANAVAELAQCNLARRSMRVFRQQQQERREKSEKEERVLKSVNSKQLKEVRKREKSGNEFLAVNEEVQTIVFKSDDGSQSQPSEPATPPKLRKKNNRNSSITKSQNSSRTDTKDSDIKMLCQLSKTNANEPEKNSSDSVKEVNKPLREKLLRQAKKRSSSQVTDTKENHVELDIKKRWENGEEEKTESSVEMLVEIKEDRGEICRSPALSVAFSLQNSTSKSQSIFEQKEEELQNSAELNVKMVETGSVIKISDIECKIPFLKTEGASKETKLIDNSKLNEPGLINSSMHLIPSEPEIMKKNIQMALEESRKTKPIIFIVQSLESEKERVRITDKKPEEPQKQDSSEAIDEMSKDCSTTTNEFSAKSKKKFKRKTLKKSKKYPITKRELRKRNIIVIKKLKPRLKKAYENIHEIKRELRSSPRFNDNKKENSTYKKIEHHEERSLSDSKTINHHATKSFRTVHTETKDLETYLHQRNIQAKTRTKTRNSTLLDKSRYRTLRNNCKLANKRINYPSKIRRSKLNVRATKTQDPKSRLEGVKNQKIGNIISQKTKQKFVPKQQTIKKQTKLANTLSKNFLENENVVVSSTTNTFDEKPPHESPNRTLLNTTSFLMPPSPIQTQDQYTQCDLNTGVRYLNTPPLPPQTMRNPLKTENGAVLYIYYELDVLIVVQEHLISFWKCSKLINMLIAPLKSATCSHQLLQHADSTPFLRQNAMENCCFNNMAQSASNLSVSKPSDCSEWIQLGELERLNEDFEITVPFANRICLHNSTPIYLEMRAHSLPKNQRDCNLLSLYINIYYYHDEEMIAKRNSIQLDSIQSDIKSVNYTTLTDSRYFIITWPQENLLGKTRSGLCKYSLTPQLDTLASIREFKSMRHTIRYLECMSDDKLIGFGETQVTIWDYRSGDVLMNFDLEIPMGRNLGSIYFPSQDIEQNNMLILHQFRLLENDFQPELMTVACTVTHTQPSYKILQRTNLSLPEFKVIKSAIKTADHLIITGQDDEEVWVSLTNPRSIMVIPRLQNTNRFYGREKSQLIELTEQTLQVNSLTNHLLQQAAGLASK